LDDFVQLLCAFDRFLCPFLKSSERLSLGVFGADHRRCSLPDLAPGSEVTRPARVLVVDDDADTRSALADLLRDLGHHVEAEPGAEAALERVGRADFDAVLSDLRMEGMDGLELCQRLLRDGPRLPVVVMTAFDDVRSALGALKAGAFDFITKPFDVDELTTALNRAVASSQNARRVERLPVPEQGETLHSGSRAAPRKDSAADAGNAPPRTLRERTSSSTIRTAKLSEVERRHILGALAAAEGNKALAARALGIDRATLYRKLRRYRLDPEH
jgi:DNA-binding NtrC family response regulator